MRKDRRLLIFYAAMGAGTLLLILALLMGYLCIAKYRHLEVPSFLLRFAPVRALLRDENFEKFQAEIGDFDEEESPDFFDTNWDYNTHIELSREQFRMVNMYGKTKYMHIPHLRKFFLKIQTEGREFQFDTIINSELQAKFMKMGPMAMVPATYDEEGFRRTDFDLQGNCGLYTLFAGDSFTEGLYVQDQETFVNQFGHLANQGPGLRVCPINSGVNGYSTLEERFVTEHFYERYAYPVVFLMHFPNDLHHDYKAVLSATAPKLETLWKNHLAELKKMTELCRRKKISLVLAAIPPKVQFKAPETRKNYQDKLRAFSEQEGVLFVDLYDAFVGEDPESFYIAGDAHFNPDGHRRAAEMLWHETRALFESLRAADRGSRIEGTPTHP